MKNIFVPYTPSQISVKDIAVCLNISIHAYCNPNEINASKLIDLAYHLSDEIKKHLTSDPVFLTIFPKPVVDYAYSFNTEVSRLEIEASYNDKKLLFHNYFRSFEDTRFSYTIKIWHDGDLIDWLDWKEESSLLIALNPDRIRPGFFLCGFDYRCEETGQMLSMATLENGYEKFNGRDFNKSVWIR